MISPGDQIKKALTQFVVEAIRKISKLIFKGK